MQFERRTCRREKNKRLSYCVASFLIWNPRGFRRKTFDKERRRKNLTRHWTKRIVIEIERKKENRFSSTTVLVFFAATTTPVCLKTVFRQYWFVFWNEFQWHFTDSHINGNGMEFRLLFSNSTRAWWTMGDFKVQQKATEIGKIFYARLFSPTIDKWVVCVWMSDVINFDLATKSSTQRKLRFFAAFCQQGLLAFCHRPDIHVSNITRK